MDKKELFAEIKEAWNILAEINDMLGAISQWADSEADDRIKQLHTQWQKLCTKTATARSVEFYNSCQELLKECDLFRTEIVRRAKSFAEKVQSRGQVIAELAGGHKETKTLMEEIRVLSASVKNNIFSGGVGALKLSLVVPRHPVVRT